MSWDGVKDEKFKELPEKGGLDSFKIMGGEARRKKEGAVFFDREFCWGLDGLIP